MESGLDLKITSLQNNRVKQLMKLRNRRQRDAQNQYLIEGYRELSRALTGFASIETLFVCEEFFLGDNEFSLIEALEKQEVEVIPCSKAVFQKMSYRDRPDGLLAIARKNPMTLADLSPKKENPCLLIAVEIEKPGNLGTILRSADASGADAVIVVDRVTDIYNPNVVRASVGTLFTQPVIETSSQEILKYLKDHQFQIIATSPDATTNYTDCDYTSKVAILMGSEQYGLTQEWLKVANHRVSIPMLGVADSLNVATSTTLMLYEVLRQRDI